MFSENQPNLYNKNQDSNDSISIKELENIADEVMTPDQRLLSYKRELEVAEEIKNSIDYDNFIDKQDLFKYINENKPKLAKEAVQRLNEKFLKEKRKEKFRQDLKDKINSLTNFIKKPFKD